MVGMGIYGSEFMKSTGPRASEKKSKNLEGLLFVF